MPGGGTPACVTQGTQWKARPVYHLAGRLVRCTIRRNSATIGGMPDLWRQQKLCSGKPHGPDEAGGLTMTCIAGGADPRRRYPRRAARRRRAAGGEGQSLSATGAFYEPLIASAW